MQWLADRGRSALVPACLKVLIGHAAKAKRLEGEAHPRNGLPVIGTRVCRTQQIKVDGERQKIQPLWRYWGRGMTRTKTEIQDASEADVEGFRRHLGPFVVAAETTRMAMVFTNARTHGAPIVFVNQAFLNLTGFEEHEVLGQRFDAFMERGTDPDSMNEIQTAMSGGRELEPVVRYKRKDASAIWVTVFITPVRNEEGGIVQHFASFVDVTLHKDEEDQLRAIISRFERSIE